MADISVIKLPNGSSYNLKDSQAIASATFSGHELTLVKRGSGTQVVDLGDFDTINVTDANIGNLVVTGSARFTNGIFGDLIGNAQTATTASRVSGVAGSTNAARHVWFSDSGTETARNYDDDFKYNPSTNTLTVANVSGNATSATTATTCTGNAATSTKANITTTANAVAIYTDTAGTFGTKATANGAAYATSTNGALTFGTLPVAQGGTGKTSGKDAANYFMNSLDTGSSTPVDADYYISQYVSGGTTTTTYHRRPMSALWSYVSGKLSHKIDGVTFNGTADIIHYGTCSTAAGTAEKAVTCASWNLVTGATIWVKFTVTNTAAVANLKLNVSSTGAKAIKYRGGNLPMVATLTANRIYGFVYDGTNFELLGDLDTDSNSDTWRAIQVNGTQIIASNSNTALNLKAGTNVSLSNSSGTVTIAATDTTYSAGVGLTLSSTTFKAKLKSETNSTQESATVGTTANRQYAVHPDKSGYLSVNVPWTDTTKATAFNSVREIKLTGDVTGSASADGSSGWSIATTVADYSHNHYPNNLILGNSATTSSLDPLTSAFIGSAASNKTFGLPANAIVIEYSTDGGSTWTDYGATDAQKRDLFAETRGTNFVLGKSTSASTNSTNNRLRVTIEPTDRYVAVHGIYVWFNTQGSTAYMDLERSTIGAKDTFTTVFTGQQIAGWSGNNIRYFSASSFGGGSSQTSNHYKYRITFYQTAINSNYSGAIVNDIRFLGLSVHSSPNNMVAKNHLYTWNSSLDATFPAQLTATKFIGNVTGNVSGTSSGVLDAGNNSSTTTFAYSKSGLNANWTTTPWFAAWNGYELRAINSVNMKTTLGLNNVDNTADANKSVASAAKFTSAQSVTLTGDTTGTASSQAGWSIATTTKLFTGTLESATALTTSPTAGKIRYSYNVNNGTAGLFNHSSNANSIITLNRHNGNYDSQIGFSSDGNIYYRSFNGSALNNTTAWKTMLDSGNYTSYTVTKTGSGASGTWGISITGNAATATTASSASALTGLTANRFVIGNGSSAAYASSSMGYFNNVDVTVASTTVKRNGLYITGAGYGNTASQLVSQTSGVLSWGDGGPQIIFSTGDYSNSSSQSGALIFTDHDSAGTGTSFHFVGNQSDWSVNSKRFVAKTSVSVGVNVPNTSYNLYVAGTANITGVTTGASFISSSKMTISSGTMTEIATNQRGGLFADGVAFSNPATRNDQGWIRCLGTSESDTVLEIATGDDSGSGEQIKARQYNTSSAVVHEMTLLDTSGHTAVPGNLTIGSGTTGASGTVKLVMNTSTNSLDFVFY